MSIIKKQFFDEVWTILVTHAGAYAGAHMRGLFVSCQCNSHVSEYRFGGELGFGGKFRRNAGRFYVNAYPEDVARNPEMQAVIDDVNQRLDALVAAHHEAAEWL